MVDRTAVELMTGGPLAGNQRVALPGGVPRRRPYGQRHTVSADMGDHRRPVDHAGGGSIDIPAGAVSKSNVRASPSGSLAVGIVNIGQAHQGDEPW